MADTSCLLSSSVHRNWNLFHCGRTVSFLLLGKSSKPVSRIKGHPHCTVSVMMCLLSSQVGFTVFMNVSGAIFAITAVALYVVDLSTASLLWMCDQSWNDTDYYEDNCIIVALYGQVERLYFNIMHRT